MDMTNKKILDATCGCRSIWFNKHHPNAVYCDKRKEYDAGVFGTNRSTQILDVNPDLICDFTDLPFADNSFSLVVLDPPPFIKCK